MGSMRIAALVCLLPVLAAADLHVAPWGADSNTGIAGAPLATIARALALASPGDRIRLATGTWREDGLTFANSGRIGAPIILEAAPGAHPIIAGDPRRPDRRVFQIIDRSDLIIRGLRIEGLVNVSPTAFAAGIVLQGDCRRVRIEGCTITGLRGHNAVGIYTMPLIARDGIATACIYDDLTISDNEISVLRLDRIHIGLAGEGGGMVINGSGTRIRVERNRIHDGIGYAVRAAIVAGTNPAVPFTDVTIADNHAWNLEVWPSEALTVAANVDGFAITGNLVHHTNFIAIDVAGGYGAPTYARNGVIRANTLHHNMGGNSKELLISTAPGMPVTRRTDGGGIGIYVDGGSGIVIEGNRTFANGDGIMIGSEVFGLSVEDVVIRNNLVYDNLVTGIIIGFHQQNPLTTETTRRCRIIGNTVVRNGTLRTVSPSYGNLVIARSADSIVVNNILVSPNERLLLRSGDADNPGLRMDRNIYWSDASPTWYTVDRTTGDVTAATSLAQHRATGQDGASLFADPRLVSATDLRLLADSPAIDAGEAATAAATDIRGTSRPQGPAPDIGAYEGALDALVFGDLAPWARFSTRTDGSQLRLTVDAGLSGDAEGPLAAWTWEFGDGRKASGRTAVHTYAAAGRYRISLTVTDNAGQTATSIQEMTVEAPTPTDARDDRNCGSALSLLILPACILLGLRSTRRATLVLMLAFAAPCSLHAQDPRIAVANWTPETDNWWLPGWVRPSPDAGFYDAADPSLPESAALLLDVTWKQLQPTPTTWDWSRIDAAIATGRPFWLRLRASDVRHCPDWLRARHPDLVPLPYTTRADPEYGTAEFYPLWHRGFDADMRALIAAFGQRGYPAAPTLRFVYVPFAWRWNEFELHFIPQMHQAGMMPGEFRAWFDRLLQSFATAFAGHTSKLVYTGTSRIDVALGDTDFAADLLGGRQVADIVLGSWIRAHNQFPDGRNRLTDAAVSAGMGVRIGELEVYNQFNHLPSWGAPAVLEGGFLRQRIDSDHPLRRGGRILGTENEGFGEAGMLPGLQMPWFQRQVTLKSLQLGLNWINLSRTAYDLDPALAEYSRRVLGRRAAESPDAWVALREWTDPRYRTSQPIGEADIDAFIKQSRHPYRNWERFLIQRDVPGGRAHAVGSTDFPALFPPWLAENLGAIEALRTDVAGGDTSLHFDIDDSFATDGPMLVLITGCDAARLSWWLEYRDAEGTVRRSAVCREYGSGRWRTLGFLVDDAKFAGGFAGETDFRLTGDGSADLVVALVRVVRLRAPAGHGAAPAALAPTAKANAGYATVTGRADPGTTVFITCDGVVHATPVVGADGRWAATIPVDGDGQLAAIPVGADGEPGPSSAASMVDAPVASDSSGGCAAGVGLAVMALSLALVALKRTVLRSGSKRRASGCQHEWTASHPRGKQ